MIHPRTSTLVGIAELKAKLSHYLHAVRAGDRITVTDRDKPVATLSPYRSEEPLRVRKPQPGCSLADLDFGPPVETDIDIVELLLEERQKHR